MQNPQIISNARYIKESCRGVITLPMLRYEAIADYYTCQPSLIRIKINEYDEFETYRQIFRFRYWKTNDSLNSWTIYSDTMDSLDIQNKDVIIRLCKWDRYSDMLAVKNATIDKRKSMLYGWPNLKVKNVYYKNESIKTVGNRIRSICEILAKGIILEPQEKYIDNKWRQIEVMSQYYWGVNQLTWDISMRNSILEEDLIELDIKLGSIIDKQSEEIHLMESDYLVPPEMLKDVVGGKYYNG